MAGGHRGNGPSEMSTAFLTGRRPRKVCGLIPTAICVVKSDANQNPVAAPRVPLEKMASLS
jgi:hypothetical protein